MFDLENIEVGDRVVFLSWQSRLPYSGTVVEVNIAACCLWVKLDGVKGQSRVTPSQIVSATRGECDVRELKTKSAVVEDLILAAIRRRKVT